MRGTPRGLGGHLASGGLSKPRTSRIDFAALWRRPLPLRRVGDGGHGLPRSALRADATEGNGLEGACRFIISSDLLPSGWSKPKTQGAGQPPPEPPNPARASRPAAAPVVAYLRHTWLRADPLRTNVPLRGGQQDGPLARPRGKG